MASTSRWTVLRHLLSVAALAVGGVIAIAPAVGAADPPSVVADPASLHFGPQPIGSPSLEQTVSITNAPGGDPHRAFTPDLANETVDGPFHITSQACNDVPGFWRCTVGVLFEPTVKGLASGELTVPLIPIGETVTVPLDGFGVSDVTERPASLEFGDVAVGTQSGTQTVVLASQSFPFSISTADAAAPFHAQPAGCGSKEPPPPVPEWDCLVNVYFAPAAPGPASGILTVQASTGDTFTVPLSGNGVVYGLDVSPADLNFPDTPLGTVSDPMTVTVTNTGNTAEQITEVSASDPFRVDGSACTGAPVPANGTCNVTVRFAPVVRGPADETLTVVGAHAGTKPVTLFGQGVIGEIGVSPAQIDFGRVPVGTSPVRTVRISNTGDVDETIDLEPVDAPFEIDDVSHCDGTTLHHDGVCDVDVGFEPTAGGRFDATLVIDASAAEAKTVTLTGFGVVRGLTVSPESLDFGRIAVGDTSAAQTITVTNTGNTDEPVTSVNVAAPFRVASDGCSGTTLVPDGSCQVSVTFAPTAPGDQTGTFGVTVGTRGSIDFAAATVPLSGFAANSAFTVTPRALDFGSVVVGHKSAARTVQVANTGNVALRIRDVSDPGFRADAASCAAAMLQPGERCTVSVRFAPATAGMVTDRLRISTSAGSRTVALSGNGVAPPLGESGSRPPHGSNAPLAATGGAVRPEIILGVLLLTAGMLLVSTTKRRRRA